MTIAIEGVPRLNAAASAEQSPLARAQAARRQRLHEAHRVVALRLHDAGGTFVGPGEQEWRHCLWNAASLLHGNEQHTRLAHNLLARSLRLGGGHFWISAVSSILMRDGHRLAADLRDKLRGRLVEQLPHEVGTRFHGYNDNFPAMAAVGLLIGAQVTGQKELVPHGLAVLQGALRLLRRRGVLSEYTSPTYSPITLAALAEIVQRSTHAEAREMALEIEQRVWTDLLAHFHPGTSCLAGPHSRAYLADLCAHPHNSHVVPWMVLGDDCFINPLSAYQNDDGRGLISDSWLSGAWARAAWYSMPTFHPPGDALVLAVRRPQPCVVEATAEQGAFPRNWGGSDRHHQTPTLEFQASETHLHTYLAADFAVGVSSRPSMDSHQHSAFHVTYRHHRPASSLRDIGAFFTRYVTSDRWHARSAHYVPDEGRTLGLGHESTAMMLYWPKPGWTARPPAQDATMQPVTSLKLAFYLASFWSSPEEVFLGEERLTGWQGESVGLVPVFLRHGPLYLALHPLVGSDLGRNAAIRFGAHDGFRRIEFVNYEGPPRVFDPVELLTCRNGFVAELGAAEDWTAFAAFRQLHGSPAITDTWRAGPAMREVVYERKGLSLGMEVSPISEGIKYRSINGTVPPTPDWMVRSLPKSEPLFRHL
jgi:hypothetical protein